MQAFRTKFLDCLFFKNLKPETSPQRGINLNLILHKRYQTSQIINAKLAIDILFVLLNCL